MHTTELPRGSRGRGTRIRVHSGCPGSILTPTGAVAMGENHRQLKETKTWISNVKDLHCPFLPDEPYLSILHCPASPMAHHPSASHLLHRSPHPTSQFRLWTSAGPDRGQTDKGVAPMRSVVAGLLLPPTPSLGPPRPALRVYTTCPWWCTRCSRISGRPPKGHRLACWGRGLQLPALGAAVTGSAAHRVGVVGPSYSTLLGRRVT